MSVSVCLCINAPWCVFSSQDSQFPLMGRVITPRPYMCHTSSLQTPNDKAQALQVSVGPRVCLLFLPDSCFFSVKCSDEFLSHLLLQESDLLSLARSLLQAWVDPLLVLSSSASSLPHPAQNAIATKIRELQEHSKSLGDGLDILSGKVRRADLRTRPLSVHYFIMNIDL